MTRLRKGLGLSLTLIPVAGQFAAVCVLGVNSVAADELLYIPFVRAVREGGPWIPMLWNLHNEHRVIPMKLAMAAIAEFGSWNIKAEMYVSAALAALLVLSLWRIYRSLGGRDPLRFAPLSLLACSFAQYENMFYGLQMCQYFTITGAAGAIALLTISGGLALSGAIVCALFASFSIINGLLIWPAGQAMLLDARKPRSRQIIWAIAGVFAFAAYFWRFQAPPGQTSFSLHTLVPTLHYAMLLLGSPLHGGSPFWARGIGIVVALAVLGAAVTWLRSPARLQIDAAPLALIAFGVLSCGMVAYGRNQVSSPITSRYIAYSTFVMTGLYLILCCDVERDDSQRPRRSLWVAALGLLLPGLMAADLEGLYAARMWRTARLGERYIIQHFDLLPDETLQLGGPPGFASYLRPALPWLRDHRLGTFAAPPDLVIVPNQQRQDTPEILAGKPVEERMPCPVGSLQDLAVIVTRTAAPPNASSASLTLWSGNQLLASRALASGIIGDGWVEIPLRKPVDDCLDRPLVLRVETTDRMPGGGIAVATYPRYYRGSLSVPDWPAAKDRSLAVMVNAYRYGMLAR